MIGRWVKVLVKFTSAEKTAVMQRANIQHDALSCETKWFQNISDLQTLWSYVSFSF